MTLERRDQQIAFFREHADALKAAAEQGGSRLVIEFIRGFDEPRERVVLYSLSRQVLAMSEWEGKNLDTVAEVARAGVEEMLRLADEIEDEDRRRQALDAANATLYNLAADLADCWPDDDVSRERRHFELGLDAAERCLALRRELEKGDEPLAIAHWAKGMHELSLGRAGDAYEDWQIALAHAKSATGDDADTFQVIVSTGYAGLGAMAAGRVEDRGRFEEAIAAFRRKLEANSDDGESAFGIAQLETVRSRYGLG